MRLEPGRVIRGRYTLIEEIGTGGFGSVWRAVDTRGGFVAVKFLKPDPSGGTARRFVREAEILARLRHPQCVTFFDFDPGDAHGGAWLATEFVEGQTLADWIRSEPSVADAIEVSVQIAAALSAAHRAGVVHRDLKPANIMVGARDGRLHVTVLDFGIGKLLDERRGDITATGEVIGTPGFMSPEQLRGHRNIGPASDLYCLGAVMFMLFARRPVFGGQSALEISMQHLTAEPASLGPSVPARVRHIVARLLAKDAEDRPASADAVVAALRSPQREVVAPNRRSDSRRRTLVGVVAVVGIALVMGLAVLLMLENRREPPPRLDPRTPVPTFLRRAPSQEPEPEPVTPSPALSTIPGCEHPYAGPRRIELLGAPMYVPSSYTGQAPVPLLILLHEARQSGEAVMEEMSFETLAEKEGFLVAAPDFQKGAGDVIDFVQGLKKYHCLDEDRIYMVGHGMGADVVDELRDSSMFAAAVATSHRIPRTDIKARSVAPLPEAVPYLLLSPKGDDQQPLEGNDHDVSLEAHLEQLRREHRCSEELQIRQPIGGVCTSWTCEIPLVSCVVEGNRHWPNYRGSRGEVGAPSKFDYQREIWNFLEQRTRPARRLSGGCGKPWPAAQRVELGHDVAYVPQHYHPWWRHAVIVALHENGQTPEEFLDELNLAGFADQHEVLVYSVQGPKLVGNPKKVSWGTDLPAKTGEHRFSLRVQGRLDRALETIDESFCVDPKRIYVVGHGASGPFAEFLRTDRRVAAVATFTHRPSVDEGTADRDRTASVLAPYLYIMPSDDSENRPSSGVLTIETSEKQLMRQHGCDPATERDVEVFEHSRCRTWTCDFELVACRIQGNRHWPGYRGDATPSDFEHQRVLSEFLLRQHLD